MTPKSNTKKYIMWDGKSLYIRYDGSAETTELGSIKTRKGNLTREQKLKAVANTRQWVEI
jgi:hypothetical protein